jgi:hypothetical protein
VLPVSFTKVKASRHPTREIEPLGPGSLQAAGSVSRPAPRDCSSLVLSTPPALSPFRASSRAHPWDNQLAGASCTQLQMSRVLLRATPQAS